ncbi:MAG: PepSY domain-containing protein [Thermodesulfobacteriota bacterium]
MLKSVQKLHRMAGLISVALVLVITVTGLLLNHREGLALYESYAEGSFVLWLYGGGEGGEGGEFSDEPPTWGRVLTAFHAGRFFGSEVSLFLDLMGAVLVALAFTGPYIWLKRRRMTGASASEVGEDALEEVVLERSEQLRSVKEAATGLLERAATLHDISEHVLHHVEEAHGDGASIGRDASEIEGHLKELDASMHKLITRIEGLRKEVTSG